MQDIPSGNAAREPTPPTDIGQQDWASVASRYEDVRRSSRQIDTRTRYIRMWVVAEMWGQPIASVAGIEVRDAFGAFVDKGGWRIHEFTSEHPTAPAANIIDGDPETIWHTADGITLPQYFTIDMGRVIDVSSVVYIPRQMQNSTGNGRIKDYILAFHYESSGWQDVKAGTFNPGNAPQDIILKGEFERNNFVFISKPDSFVEDWEDKGLNQERAVFEPTGLYGVKDTHLSVTVGNLPEGVSCELLVGTYGYGPPPTYIRLSSGYTNRNMPRDGLISVKIIHPTRKFLIPVSLNAGTRMSAPFYILGKNTQDEWPKMLRESSAPSALLYSGKAVIIVTKSKAVEFQNENIDALLEDYNRIIDKADDVHGFNQSLYHSNGIHLPSTGNYHFEETDHDGVFMNAGYYATRYHRDVVDRILTRHGLTQEGWGPWHELGHMYQMRSMGWENTTESNNNIVSAAIEAMYGVSPTYIQKYGVEEEAIAWLASGSGKKFEEASNNVAFFFFHSLAQSHGGNFYPTLFQAYREVLNDGEFNQQTQTAKGRREMFAFMASKCARRNLVNYLNNWGFHLLPQTINKINALGFPPTVSSGETQPSNCLNVQPG